MFSIGRSVRATSPALQLTRAVRLAIRELQAALDEMSALQRAGAGRIVVATLPLPRAALLPQAPPRQEEQPKAGARRIEEALFAGMPERERAKPEEEADATLTVSDRELLQRKDFAQMTATEIAAAKDAIKRLVL